MRPRTVVALSSMGRYARASPICISRWRFFASKAAQRSRKLEGAASRQKEGKAYVADAKYKPFFNWHADQEAEDTGTQFFNVADVRQLTCYGLLASPKSEEVELQIIYPFIGDGELPAPIQKETFAGMPLIALAIRVSRSPNTLQLISRLKTDMPLMLKPNLGRK